MKKIIFILFALPFIVGGCNQATKSPAGKDQMTMTLKANGKVQIFLAGNGSATIDWGDGSPVETRDLKDCLSDNDDECIYNHTYSGASVCVITITGGEIPHLNCSGMGLTSLDVSQNAQLKYLYCDNNQLKELDLSQNTQLVVLDCEKNQLKKLDVSQNTKLESLNCAHNQLTSLNLSKNVELTWLNCSSNRLTASELNALFGSLNKKELYDSRKGINIEDNPGTYDCEISIAEKKEWERVFNEGYVPPQNEFVKTMDRYEFTNLGLAIYNGNLNAARRLIMQGANKERCLGDETFQYDVLYTSVLFGKIDLLEYFINTERNVNKVYDENGVTLLSLACMKDDPDMTFRMSKMLIEAGANVNGGGDMGFDYIIYPLFGAVRSNNFKLVKLLVEHGADITVADKQGETVFSIMERGGVLPEIKEYIQSRRQK